MSYWPDTDQIGSLYTESVAIGSGRFIPPQSVTIGDRALRARFSIHQSDWIFSRIRSGGVTWTFHCINWYFWRHLRFTLFWQRHNTRPTNFAMKRFHLDNYIFSSSTLKKFQLLTNGPFLSHCVQYATSIQKLAVTQIFCFGLVFSVQSSQKICESVVQYCSSQSTACRKKHAWLGCKSIFLELLHPPLQLRCANRSLDDLTQASAAVVEVDLVRCQVCPSVRRDYPGMQSTIGRVSQNNIAGGQVVQKPNEWVCSYLTAHQHKTRFSCENGIFQWRCNYVIIT